MEYFVFNINHLMKNPIIPFLKRPSFLSFLSAHFHKNNLCRKLNQFFHEILTTFFIKFYQFSSWNSINILNEILSIFFAKHYGPKGEPACSKLTTHTVVSSASPHVAIQSLPVNCFPEEKIVTNNVSKNFKYKMLKNWEVKIFQNNWV